MQGWLQESLRTNPRPVGGQGAAEAGGWCIICFHAGIAQLVERNLAKVEVASSSLVSRSRFRKASHSLPAQGKRKLPFFAKHGAVAKRLCTGLQIRVGRFDSGPRLQNIAQLASAVVHFFFLHTFAHSLHTFNSARHLRQAVQNVCRLQNRACRVVL